MADFELENGYDGDDESDDGFEDNMLYAASHSEVSVEVALDVQDAEQIVKDSLPSEFLKEAIGAATSVSRVSGDGDGWLAEQSSIIIANILAFLTIVKDRPEDLIFTRLQTFETNADKVAYLEGVKARIEAVLSQL